MDHRYRCLAKIFILPRIIIILDTNQEQNFKADHVKAETYAKQFVSYLGPKIWNSIPQEITLHFSLSLSLSLSLYIYIYIYLFFMLEFLLINSFYCNF